MKNSYLHYSLLFIPMIVLFILVRTNVVSTNFFVMGILTYCFIYSPYLTGRRLVLKHTIQGKDFWKIFIPFWNMKYYRLDLLKK